MSQDQDVAGSGSRPEHGHMLSASNVAAACFGLAAIVGRLPWTWQGAHDNGAHEPVLPGELRPGRDHRPHESSAHQVLWAASDGVAASAFGWFASKGVEPPPRTESQVAPAPAPETAVWWWTGNGERTPRLGAMRVEDTPTLHPSPAAETESGNHLVQVLLALGFVSGACTQAWACRILQHATLLVKPRFARPSSAAQTPPGRTLAGGEDGFSTAPQETACWYSMCEDAVLPEVDGTRLSERRGDARDDSAHLDCTVGPRHCRQHSFGSSRMSLCSAAQRSPEHFFIFDEEDLEDACRSSLPSPCPPVSPSGWSLSPGGDLVSRTHIHSLSPSMIEPSGGVSGVMPSDAHIYSLSTTSFERSAVVNGELPGDCSVFTDGGDSGAVTSASGSSVGSRTDCSVAGGSSCPSCGGGLELDGGVDPDSEYGWVCWNYASCGQCSLTGGAGHWICLDCRSSRCSDCCEALASVEAPKRAACPCSCGGTLIWSSAAEAEFKWTCKCPATHPTGQSPRFGRRWRWWCPSCKVDFCTGCYQAVGTRLGSALGEELAIGPAPTAC